MPVCMCMCVWCVCIFVCVLLFVCSFLYVLLCVLLCGGAAALYACCCSFCYCYSLCFLLLLLLCCLFVLLCCVLGKCDLVESPCSYPKKLAFQYLETLQRFHFSSLFSSFFLLSNVTVPFSFENRSFRTKRGEGREFASSQKGVCEWYPQRIASKWKSSL